MNKQEETAHGLFERETTCPLCSRDFKFQRVRTSAIRIKKRHEDYYTEYKSANPNYYAVLVCPYCGYAAFEKDFQSISEEHKLIIWKNVSENWKYRDLGGVRSVQDAIDAYKLALLCYKLRNSESSTIGKLCIRLMWFYRSLGDKKEVEFIQFARNSFEEAFMTEDLSADLDNELMVLYLVGELSRQLGDFEKSVVWFDKAVNHPLIKKKRHVEMRVRDQWSLAREQYNQKRAVK